MKKATIKLGGREITLSPLTLDQLQEVMPHLNGASPLTKEGIKALRQAIVAASNNQINDKDLGLLPITVEELFDAQKALADMTGLRPLNERLAREAEEASRSSGTPSTPLSAPTPAGPGRPSVN